METMLWAGCEKHGEYRFEILKGGAHNPVVVGKGKNSLAWEALSGELVDAGHGKLE